MAWHRRLGVLIAALIRAQDGRYLRLGRVQARWPVYVGRAKAAFGCLGVLLLSGAEGGLEREIDCLARNIYFEARYEPEDGRRAVAHVVVNRVSDRRWPGSVCAVVEQGWPEDGPLCQFSWVCDGRDNRPPRDAHWDDALTLAERVYWGWSRDPTDGALWYHAEYVEPHWRRALTPGPQIGGHIFYRDNG